MGAVNLTAHGAAIRQKGDARDRAGAETTLTARRWLTGIVAAGALLIPLVVSVTGEDPFRYPKELALRFEVILLVAALAIAWGFGRLALPRLDVREKWLALTAAICAWTIVCALASTNRLVSFASTVLVLEYALLFAVTVLVMRGRPVWFAALALPPAIVNAVVYILQEVRVWTPFDTSRSASEHLARTAMLGNPNDVGSYLVSPALVAAALALSQRRVRAAWAAATALLVAAVFVTQTAAAIGALVVALAVMVALRLRSWRKNAVALLAVIAAASLAVAAYAPLRARVVLMRDALASRDYEVLSAQRTIPFLAAAEMVRDHPLTGVGPGAFAFNFFDYKLRVQERHRWLFGPAKTVENYGEVHNDHLQIASQTGLPGYALFAAALLLLASATWRLRRRSDDDGERTDLVRLLALPLAVSMFVLALAQFPLELIASTHAYLWAAAAVVSWGKR